MLRFAVLLLQATLLLGTLLFRPTLLNFFDLPIFFEKSGIHSEEDTSDKTYYHTRDSAFKGSICTLGKHGTKEENKAYQR